MIPLSAALPALPLEVLSLYYTQDALLEGLPVLVFCGPSTTANSTQNSSRIQAHVYSLAGFHSAPRLTVAPNSPLYAAVSHLPDELQGDEVYRGLAVSLLNYFAELPQSTKTALRDLTGARRRDRLAPMMFDEMHAGDLATNMVQIENTEETAGYLTTALAARSLSCVDMDVILPPGTIQRATTRESGDEVALFDDGGLPLYHYGQYNPIIDLLGAAAFLPSSKLQRAPSRPTIRSKSKFLSKDQKISLRREMVELVETESNYLGKVQNLIHVVAVDFRQTAATETTNALFPESLEAICKTNRSFYEEIQSILDSTENDAIKDIEGGQSASRDPTGAHPFAMVLIRWFPRFKSPYQAYLRASMEFPQIIAQSLLEDCSSTSDYLREFGDQRLRSALIEPVQRLPRYSLLIDNMINLLPISHPALASLLKAKDIITDICALDSAAFGNISRTIKILRNVVSDWPKSFSPSGRLIAAVDVEILDPPYSSTLEGAPGMLLLFPDTIVLLRKVGEAPLSARGLLAERDHPSVLFGPAFSSALDLGKGLRLFKTYGIQDCDLTESSDGRLIYMTELQSEFQSPQQLGEASAWVFSLLSPYDGKAARFSEEIVKARIEGRYPEEVRDSDKWALRSISGLDGRLTLLAALSEGFAPTRTSQGISGIQVSFDKSANARSILTEKAGSQIAASVAVSETDNITIEVAGRDHSCFTDECTVENLVPVLVERLKSLLLLQYQRGNTAAIASRISFHRAILEALPLREERAEKRHRGFRPISPVKMISHMLGGSKTIPRTPSKPRAPLSSAKPDLSARASKTPYAETGNDGELNEKLLGSKVTLVGTNSETPTNSLAVLEDTFAAYIISLHSRSGNVVGRVLQSRATADELAVNELYNTLLEDPSRLETTAVVPVDVLFAAFEKFLRRGWREQMGPLIPPNVIQSMQSGFDSGKPALFAQQVRKGLEEMSPQNRRALVATVRLLSDLLEASGNDGDRGILIASFAEALVLVGNPHDYITLLDRLVDDFDSLFEFSSNPSEEGNTRSATGSLTRTRSFNTGSISSNTSSLRRKFGLGPGLSRENSRNEPESKIASIWRTLSKSSKNQDESCSQPSSLSKGSLIRSRSTDTDPRMLPPSRPVSRDRPTTSGSLISEGLNSRPGSAHLNSSALNSIGEETPSKPVSRLKKKRRSSLSDLKTLENSGTAKAWSPLQVRTTNMTQDQPEQVKMNSHTPSPRTDHTYNPRLGGQSTQRSGIPQRFGSPRLKENSPSREKAVSKENSPSMIRPPTKMTTPRSDEVTITSHSPKKRTVSRSNIPTPKSGLSERTWPPNGNNTLSKKATSSPQKLRVQSPQKLRERLSQEQKSHVDTEASLQAEINKISEEMSAFKQSRPSAQASSKDSSQPNVQSLATTLAALEKKLHAFTVDNAAQTAAIRTDGETSLLVSNKKVRKLNELYKEANAENEVLYERFNDELRKVLGKIRKGEGVEEMRKQLGEAQDEVGRLKAENAKLKGDIVGLKSMVKGD